MREILIDRMPSGFIIFCAVLSMLLPWAVYAINRKLHQMGDPPWQQGMDRDPSDMPGNTAEPDPGMEEG